MRPCNQCRQPVENSVAICDDCRLWNATHSEHQSGAKSNRKDATKENANPQADYSYAILMGAFSMVITALFALIGMAIYGIDGFVVGGSIGLIVGVIVFSIAIKM